MKLLLMSLLALSATAVAGPLEGLTREQPICYGREYSEAHMKNHPLQTVKLLRLKFYQNELVDDDNALLDVQAHLKQTKKDSEGQEYSVYKPYSSGMFCVESDGRVECRIDCDGGSAKVTWNVTRWENEILFKNEGFVMVGGCGDEEGELIWLDPHRGGDDIFRLYALPKEYCQN